MSSTKQDWTKLPYGILHADERPEGSHRDWWSGGTWTVPGDVIVEMTAKDLAEIKAMREVVTAAEAVKSTIGTDGKITWTHANAVWLLKAVDALRTLSTPESEVK